MEILAAGIVKCGLASEKQPTPQYAANQQAAVGGQQQGMDALGTSMTKHKEGRLAETEVQKEFLFIELTSLLLQSAVRSEEDEKQSAWSYQSNRHNSKKSLRVQHNQREESSTNIMV